MSLNKFMLRALALAMMMTFDAVGPFSADAVRPSIEDGEEVLATVENHTGEGGPWRFEARLPWPGKCDKLEGRQKWNCTCSTKVVKNQKLKKWWPSLQACQFYYEMKDWAQGKVLPTHLLTLGQKKSNGGLEPATAKCAYVAYVTDLEGNYLVWLDFVMLAKDDTGAEDSELFETVPTGGIEMQLRDGNKVRRQLKKNVCLVFGGDVLDGAKNAHGDYRCSPVTIAKNLVQLSEQNTDRVVLLLGNRDANKLRLKSELSDGATNPDDFRPYWVTMKDTDVAKLASAWPHKGGRLAELLSMSMGASIEPFASDPEVITEIAKEHYANLDKNPTGCDTCTQRNLRIAEYVEKTLLSSTAPGNWWFKYLKRAVTMAAVTWRESPGGTMYALYAHSGLHPFMFHNGVDNGFMMGSAGSLMVPTLGGILKEPRSVWAKANVIDMQVDRPAKDRVALRRDRYLAVSDASATKDIGAWMKDLAISKERELDYWISTAPTGFTRANRPGLQLMDGGLGALAGTYRNAGFTTAGPMGVSWEYGVNLGMPWLAANSQPGQQFSNVGASSPVGGMMPRGGPSGFGKLLMDNGVKYVFDGHFSVPGLALPSVFKMNQVTVHNLELANLGKDVHAEHGAHAVLYKKKGKAITITRYASQEGSSKPVEFETIDGPMVGKDFQVENVLTEEIPKNGQKVTNLILILTNPNGARFQARCNSGIERLGLTPFYVQYAKWVAQIPEKKKKDGE